MAPSPRTTRELVRAPYPHRDRAYSLHGRSSRAVYTKKKKYLLVSSTRCNEEEDDPLPKLVPGKAIDGHVGEVAPKDGCRDFLDQRHAAHGCSDEDRLEQVAQSLLVHTNWQVIVDVLSRIESEARFLLLLDSHHCILQVLQLLHDRVGLQ